MVIIGAGESGLLTALRLKQAGVPFKIFEKNSEVGGTWWGNQYPGIRVGSNSYIYSFAFARGLWPDFYGKGGDVMSYFKAIADEWGLREQFEFNSEVMRCTWNEATSQWDLIVEKVGQEVRQSSEMLVCAVGQLNRPRMPDIEGQDRFKGPSFHSASWDRDVDYADKRVGVIGTGASALQFIPELAETAEQVTDFLRTVPWLLPTPLLHEEVPPELQWLMVHIPTFAM